MMNDVERVAFVGGVGRSGSTLIELALGQLPSACPLGEVRHIWQRGLIENQRCGCGNPFGSCAFWKAVGVDAFGGWDRVDVPAVQRLKAGVDRGRHVPRLLARGGPAFGRAVGEYTALYRRIYAAARQVSGRSMIIDSSKHISLAACLARDPGVDLRVLHVVRDPLGVAYSWSKQKVRPEVTSGEAYMPRYSAGHVGLQWNAHNTLYEVLGHRLGERQRLLRYEDFVQAPATTLAGVADFLHVDPSSEWLRSPDARTLTIDQQHTVAGNPLRFVRGPVEVRADVGWRQGLGRRARVTVIGTTYPLARRYGYAVTGGIR